MEDNVIQMPDGVAIRDLGAVLISFVRKLELRNICGDNYEAFAIGGICFNSLFAIASYRRFSVYMLASLRLANH